MQKLIRTLDARTIAVPVALTVLISPAIANAAVAGGGAMPWDNIFTTIETDLTGPVAGLICLIAMAVCGITLIFGGEISEFIRRLLYVGMVGAFLVGIPAFAAAIGLTGAIV